MPTQRTLARSWPQFGVQLPGTLRRSHDRGSAFSKDGGWPPSWSCLSRGEESLAVKDLPLTQQVIDGTAQASRQRAQGAGLAVLLLAASQPLFGLLTFADEQAGGLGEGPLQVGVADLVAAAALLLAGRLVCAADQPSVGQKLSDFGEAADVVDLVEQDQGQHLADAGHGTQAVKGLRIIHLGGPGQ